MCKILVNYMGRIGDDIHIRYRVKGAEMKGSADGAATVDGNTGRLLFVETK